MRVLLQVPRWNGLRRDAQPPEGYEVQDHPETQRALAAGWLVEASDAGLDEPAEEPEGAEEPAEAAPPPRRRGGSR